MIHAESTVNYTLVNCVFENNSARFHGGGGYIFVRGAFGLNQYYHLENNIFKLNRARRAGGAFVFALDIYSSSQFVQSAVMHNCVFANNTAGFTGGALYIIPIFRWIINSHVRIEDSKFYGNKAVEFGGAINIFIADPRYLGLNRQNFSAAKLVNW